ISQTQSSPLAAGQTIRDVAGGEVRMADVAEESRQAARTAATSAAAQGEATATLTGFGPPTTLETVTTKAKSVLKQAEDAARAEASRRYDEIESLAGDAPVVRMTQTGERAKEILADEAQMSRLAKPTITRAAGAAEDVAGTGAPTVHLGGVATSLQSLPREIIEALGLDRAEAVTFKQARTLESRIGGLLRSTTDDYVKRQLRFLRDAVRQDVEAFTQSAPGDLGVKLRDANEFYRTRVAMPFGADSDIRTLLNQTEPAKIEAMLFDKRGAERLLGIKAEMDRLDPTAWALVRSRFGDRLMREAVDPTTNLFSDEKFARAVAQYPPEVIRAVLGDKATNLARLVEGYQAAGRAPANVVSPIQASAIFREYAKKVPEDIVASLGTLQPSEIRSIKEKLGPAAWGPIGRAWWEHAMLPKSHGKEEMFSRSRFLTQLKKTNPETLRELLGAEATDGLARLRAVLERQERVHPLGDNPSGTAQALMGSEQLWKIVQVGGAVAMGKVAGITSGGAVLLTPALMARLLSSPRGIRLFTEGVMAPQGSKSAQDAALRIGIFLSSQSTPEQQESAPVPMR
ncbi:MAG TPA: hypothetical protein VJ301_18910, partial [Propionibacteriaceae bacterium]|nr:hypothetical protein [Propionibacteriaceae bacterium]